jgi:hypothetical protein
MKISTEQQVKKFFPESYSYEFNGSYYICDFPGRDGMDIGCESTREEAWQDAFKKI